MRLDAGSLTSSPASEESSLSEGRRIFPRALSILDNKVQVYCIMAEIAILQFLYFDVATAQLHIFFVCVKVY